MRAVMPGDEIGSSAEPIESVLERTTAENERLKRELAARLAVEYVELGPLRDKSAALERERALLAEEVADAIKRTTALERGHYARLSTAADSLHVRQCCVRLALTMVGTLGFLIVRAHVGEGSLDTLAAACFAVLTVWPLASWADFEEAHRGWP